MAAAAPTAALATADSVAVGESGHSGGCFYVASKVGIDIAAGVQLVETS